MKPLMASGKMSQNLFKNGKFNNGFAWDENF